MVKAILGVVVLVSMSMVGTASAADCKKTLMGNDCIKHESGTSSHMRGDAVANAKAAKELKAAQEKAHAKAVAMKK